MLLPANVYTNNLIFEFSHVFSDHSRAIELISLS